MKLLVFAHIPPPHHGQSYMVKLMIDGFGGDMRQAHSPEARPIECYHVNSRFSDSMDDIGEIRFGKGFLVLRYCLEAIWCRFRYGVKAFYYVPAPGKRAALYRDWIVLFFCRPFFKDFILHWHAVGMGDWLRREGNWFELWVTNRLLSHCTLSLALAISSMRDALWLHSRSVEVVPNGIPDPCPDFDQRLLPQRVARTEARRKLLRGEPRSGDDPALIRALYIAHCTRDKGVFDALESVALFNRENSTFRIHLTVAGSFLKETEEQEFRSRIEAPDLAQAVTYAGFAGGEAKQRLFEENDFLCFPTFYIAEGLPVNLIEAMAFGMTVVTTRWRSIPEILPADYPGFVEPHQPGQIAAVFRSLAVLDFAQALRTRYSENFSAESHLAQMRAAVLSTAAK